MKLPFKNIGFVEPKHYEHVKARLYIFFNHRKGRFSRGKFKLIPEMQCDNQRLYLFDRYGVMHTVVLTATGRKYPKHKP